MEYDYLEYLPFHYLRSPSGWLHTAWQNNRGERRTAWVAIVFLLASSVAASAQAPREALRDTLRSGGEGPLMIIIPAGRFRMGCLSYDDDCRESELPVRDVEILRPFALSAYEVTFADWDACVSAGGCGGYRPDDEGWGRGGRPVINVSWDDAVAYASWLSVETEQTYRLPSESEWEYAARAGTATKYSWGNEVARNRANCNGCGSRWDDSRTAPVGAFPPNAYGLHEMHGNVAEWVEDCWNTGYYGAPRYGEAWGGGDCERRIWRGGAFGTSPRWIRAALRFAFRAEARARDIGFRVVRTLTPRRDASSDDPRD